MDYPEREVYPSAPIAIVTAEIQFGYEPALNDRATRDAFAERVRSFLPSLREDSGDWRLRATSEDLQTTATLSSGALEVAMSGTAYTRYEESFGPAVERVCEAFAGVAPSTQVVRVGLRYIDEIRVPSPPTEVAGWSEWIADELVAGATMLPGASGEQLRAVTQFRSRDGARVDFQWGTLHAGTVVAADLPFRASRPPADIFVLDVDASWESDGRYRKFDTAEVAAELAALHVPCGEIFAKAQKPALKEIFRKERTS
jgi:uncharacterized protein (TIGR04255 family)